MAVVSAPHIAEFYQRHKLMSLLVIVLFQIAAASVFGGAILLTSLLTIHDAAFWVLVAIGLVTNLSVNIIAMTVIIEPMEAIAGALSYVAGEKSVTPPPNPNIRRYEKNGTKTMLNLIYGLSSQTNETKPGLDTEAASAGSQPQLLDTALSHSLSSIIILDAEQKIIYASKNAPVKKDTENGLLLDVVFDSSDVSLSYWLAECGRDTISAEKIWTRIHTNPDSASVHKIYDIAASYSRGSQSEIVLIIQDRTSQYEPDENDLDFIAFAAHELRGPITVIRGYLDILEDELDKTLSEDQRILLGRLVVSANRLSTYVDNILNVSRYDRRHYRVQLSPQRLFDLYDSISDDMSARASTQNRLLAVDIPHDLPMVAADANSVSEVFANLIDNAIKYSNEGGAIEVHSHVNADMVEVSVTDHGIGMPDSVVQNLFHKFYRSHRSRESVAGSGIGLYISKAIVESHGGTISVRSSEDKGSTFTFSLPIYSTIEQKLAKGDNGNNEAVISKKHNWISNHNMYRG